LKAPGTMAAAAGAGGDAAVGKEFVVAGMDLTQVFGSRVDVKLEEEVK
jgi:hypothetical protein